MGPILEESSIVPLDLTNTTANNHRVANFLRKARLSPPQSIPSLSKPPPLDFECTLPSNSNEARSLLVQQRINEPGYRQPEKQKRNILRLPKQKEKKTNQDMWSFSKHEVAKAFNDLLSRIPPARCGIAQSLLSHTSITSLDELWHHFHDPKLEISLESRFRQSKSSIIPDTSWLDDATRQDNVEFIHLMCQAGFAEEVLTRAFSIALSNRSMEAMKVLLVSGAIASAYKVAIREHVRADDVALVSLLVSVPNAMSIEAWRYCMESEVESLQLSGKKSPNLLLMCVSHHPDIICGILLIKALKSQNFQATAIILAYARSNEDFRDVRDSAIMLASKVQEDKLRHEFFMILADAGFVTDVLILREELMKDVITRHLPLVQLLVNAGISLDIHPNNALNWAVSQMDLEILELFKGGTFSLPVSLALNHVPDSTPELDVLRLVDIFSPIGLSGEPLHSHLARAVRKQHVQLLQRLLRYGASIEFEQALAIRIALKKADLSILAALLQSKCSPHILSAAIPVAMALHPRLIRLQGMKALLEKGVLSQELGTQLQKLMSEDGTLDIELIRLLLQHKAPVDGFVVDGDHFVSAAARRGNISVLKMLCNAKPQNQALSTAVPVAFGAISTSGYEIAFDMIKLLLQNGAAGLPIDETLLTAAIEDRRLDIVRLLLGYGADANYVTGASFDIALKAGNLEMLEMLCARCPPNRACAESLLFTAIDARNYNLQALEMFLGSIPSVAAILNAMWVSENFRGNANITEIVSCFLRHGLAVDIGKGSLLCLAIEANNIKLLENMLSANPSIASLRTAFRAATSVQSRNMELEIMRLLLEKAKSTEIGQTASILQQTNKSLLGDIAGLQLIIRHQAVVDLIDGQAVQIAAVAGCIESLDLLLSARPRPLTIKKACLAVASSKLTPEQKHRVFERLLAANGGLSAKDKSNLLNASITSLPEFTQLPQLLLVRSTEIKYENLKGALEKASRNLFVILADSIQSANTLLSVFRQARKITMPLDRRYWVYEYLLLRCIPNDDISKALLDALKLDDFGDLSLHKLLLENGAKVGYKKGAALSLALRAKSTAAVRLLSQYINDDDMAGMAFDLARKALLDPPIRLEIYRCFLHQWNISKLSIYEALEETIGSGQSSLLLVQLLLWKGADPNSKKAHCFVLASNAEMEPEFRALCKHAELSVVFNALLDHFKEEWEILRWFNICLEEQNHSTVIDDDNLLFQCLCKFPRGILLLGLLLDKGVPASAKFDMPPTGWQLEACTFLIWALFSWRKISNEAILVLLHRRADSVLPAYSTPVTKVSAAFGCLLDKTRMPILKALLEIDRDQILKCVIPGSSFSYLGAYPNICKDGSDIVDEVPLLEASLYLGNFEAFCLMNDGEARNDGKLQSAAHLALPEFVHWLLNFHDPDFKAEEYSNYIPLAIVCKSTFNPWCKIANQEMDWRARQKKTMQILARVTDSKWRHRQKTVLHIALENGIETTNSMIEALDILNDPEKDEKYLYKDKDEIEYSPHTWVQKFLETNKREKKALITCLNNSGMQSRYFKRISPDAGSQPEGYHGLPLNYADLWKAHEQALRTPASGGREVSLDGRLIVLGGDLIGRIDSPDNSLDSSSLDSSSLDSSSLYSSSLYSSPRHRSPRHRFPPHRRPPYRCPYHRCPPHRCPPHCYSRHFC